jgi:hypothetical protein
MNRNSRAPSPEYALEEEIREKTPEERDPMRNTRSLPIFEKMKVWVEGIKPKVPIKSKIGGNWLDPRR